MRSFTSSDTAHRLAALAAALRCCGALSLVEPEVAGLSRIVRAGDVCLDIGAAYGMHSFPLAHLVGPSGQVHAFEPQPGPRSVLTAARRLCAARNLEVHPTGMGAEAGTREMVVPVHFGLPIRGHAHVRGDPSVPGGFSRIPRRFSRTCSWPVPVRSVDEFRAERSIGRIDFLKLDVEGFEPTVLEGARNTLAEDRPALLLEIEERHLARYGADSEEFSRFLRGLGYGQYVWKQHVWKPGHTWRRGLPASAGDWRRTDDVTRGTRNYLFATDEMWER